MLETENFQKGAKKPSKGVNAPVGARWTTLCYTITRIQCGELQRNYESPRNFH